MLIEKDKHTSLFEKLQVLAKWTIFHGFSRNEALFKSFCWKLDQNAKTCQFVRKVSSFTQIEDFLWYLTKWGTFCTFLLKTWSKRKNMPLCSKKVKFWPNRGFFMVFHEMKVFNENLIKTQKQASLFKKCQVLPKLMTFHGFSRHEALFANFPWKLHQNRKTCQFVRKVECFGQIDDFSRFFRKWGTFCNYSLKSWWKRKNMPVFWNSCKFWPNRLFFMVFHEMRHFLHLLAKKLIKTQKHASFFEKLKVLAKSIIFHGFSRNEALFASFCWKLDQNAKTCQFLREMSSFAQIDDF